MKFGVLGFGYENFPYFQQQLELKGYYTANLGDNAQSIATRNIYRQFGISDDQTVTVNRDSLATYDGEEAVLIMNGVFDKKECFPVSERIIPIFIGFHAIDDVVKDNVAYLKKHEPIGCRDSATTALLTSYGVAAFTSGCLTLTFPTRPDAPRGTKLLIVNGWDHLLPSQAIKYIPDHLADTIEFIYHRIPVFSHPLSPQQCKNIERYEEDMIAQYRDRATLVLTPLHHVCTPCIAMGIPVIVCRNTNDIRFSYLEDIMPIYTPERFATINWEPEPVAIDAIKSGLIQMVRDRLRAVGAIAA